MAPHFVGEVAGVKVFVSETPEALEMCSGLSVNLLLDGAPSSQVNAIRKLSRFTECVVATQKQVDDLYNEISAKGLRFNLS